MNKEHILAELRRTAAANGGAPLGQGKFRAETGIRRSDWYGRHWATWGDAQREAGFSANELTEALDETEMIASYARLAQRLAHLPTDAEIRLEKHNDPTFPSATTITARLGSKADVLAKVVRYCREREGLGAVAEMCEAYRPRTSEDDTNESPATSGEETGFVYLMKSGAYFKIGKTNSVGRREREFAIQLPDKPSTVHVIRTDDPTGIERYWHGRFDSKRIRKEAEFFKLTPADIAAFRRRKFM